MGRIADLGDLKRAWERVKSNKGSGGIDGETVEAFGERAWTHLREMQSELLEGRYRPVPVRGVEIPKPNGGKRQLGIPTVKDRIVQQAVAQAITPRCERVFSDSSYGFRPNRRAHDALRRGSAYVAEGYSAVVDLDLSKFFDRVNHDRLMARPARDIGDGRVLRLVLAFLKAGLMQNGVCRRREEGTPLLMSKGLPERWTWGVAKCSHGWYRMSNTPQATKAMGLEWFREIGYIPLTA